MSGEKIKKFFTIKNGFIKHINKYKDDQCNKGNGEQKEEALQRGRI